MGKITTEKFIEKAKCIHGDRYDYSKVVYKKAIEKVCIVCPVHGEFWQTPNSHLNGSGCPKCGKEKIEEKKKITQDEFLRRSKSVHGNTYDYSMVDYRGCYTPVKIICKKHGVFEQEPILHYRGYGCKECTKELLHDAFSFSREDFIRRARDVHGDKYDYSKVEYYNGKTKVCIICPKHGEFWQEPNSHLAGHGCKKCSLEKLFEKRRLSLEEFINRANKVHNQKYDYSKVEFDAVKDKVCIICPKHGEFWQEVFSHLSGVGCPKCSASKMESSVAKYLDEKNIAYEYQKKFEWLKGKRGLLLDFYLPSKNIAIECQGYQHFQPIYYSKGKREKYEKKLVEIQIRDKLKKELCEQNGVHIEYINYFDDCIGTLKKILEKYGAASKKEN